MKNRLTVGASSLVLCAAAIFTASIAAETDGDVAAKGHDILAANCGRCHAIEQEGESSHAQAPPFRVVVSRYPPSDLAEALAEGIMSGHPDMPEFVFEPPEIEAILAYLGSLEPEPEPDQSN